MEIGVVECPDPVWAPRVAPLLGHKGPPWTSHIEAALQAPLDALETRFYLGLVEGQPITNVMIVGARASGGRTSPAAGILGHVYTVPEHRRKGAYSHLMAAQMAHTAGLGYRVLTLGTGFETPPYWIYHSFGFRTIDGTSGRMKWLADPDAEQDWFRAGATRVRVLRWDDWPRAALLGFQPDEPAEELPRSWALRLPQGHGSVEGSFLDLRRALPRESPATLEQAAQALGAGQRTAALMLETEHGAAAGWAILQPDELALRDAWRLDACVHPAFRGAAADLIAAAAALPGGAARVTAYTSTPDGYRAAALRAAGFDHVADLPGWLPRGGGSRETLRAYARGG